MKVGLVLEGGSMRGLYTTGILDIMLDNNINIDTIIGVSAGALFGANYPSKQKGRAIRYNKNYINDKRYISIRNLLLTGNMINKKFAYYTMTKKLDPFDNDEFIKSNIDFYATATNIATGEPEYFKITNPIEEMEILRATSAIPLVTKPVNINNNYYLDGGVSDSIPIQKMLELNCDKIIVILTQPLDYVKHPLSKNKEKMIRHKYRKYPNLINAIINRYKKYNETLDLIKKLESKGDILVLRPKTNIHVNILKTNPNELEQVYNQGLEIGKENINKIKEYLMI